MLKRKFRPWWLLLLLGLGTVIGLGLFRYGPHLQWRLSPGWITTRGSQPMPVSTLPDSPSSDDVARCQFGPLAFSVPKQMASSPKFQGERMSGVILRDGPREVFVGLPHDNRQVAGAIRLEFADAGGLSSISRLWAEVYAASPADFRWSMSRQELARHQRLLKFAFLGRGPSARAVETSFGGQVEGLLVLREGMTTFDWAAADGDVAGNLVFSQRSGKIDPAWIRPICASLRYTHGVFGDEITADDVAKLFRVE